MAQIGNKNASKNKPITELIIQALQEELEVNGKKTKKMRLLAQRLVNEALKGGFQEMKEVLDRVEGKPHQTTTNENIERLVFEAIEVLVLDDDSAQDAKSTNGSGLPTVN